MPGIAGIFAKQITGQEEWQLDRMVALMSHEPFYKTGKCAGANPGVSAGFIAINGSFADCMPIRNEAGDITLLLTGECYIEPSDVTALASRGHKFSTGNANYLVHLYEEEGERFFSRLNGWFNGLIIDRRTGRSHLFNDRYGIRRIYYRETADGLFFSSEAKSLLAMFPGTRTIDPQSLGEYVSYGSVLSNRTLFQGISILPPGSVWTFDGRRLKKRSHTDPAGLESLPKLPATTYIRSLEEAFLQILPKYLAGDPKCLALTGGMDTRLIIACAGARPGELPCLTHGGMYKEMLDVRIARKVAEICSQPYHVIPLDHNFLTTFPATAEKTIYLTDGLADVFQSHHLYLNRCIRDMAGIKITGKYGSQVIKHISAFHRPTGYGSDEGLTSPDFRGHLAAAKEIFREHDKGHPLSQMLFKEIPWWWGGILSIEFTQLTGRSPYLDNEFVDLLYRSPFPAINPVAFQLGLVKKLRPDLYGIMTDSGYGGAGSMLARNVRRQFYRLLKLIEKAYDRDKLPYTMHHSLASLDYHLLSPLRLNSLFLGVADYRHYRIWTRDDLADYIKGILLAERTLSRPFWNRRYLERAVGDHIRGRKNRLAEIQKVLSIELVHRTLIENTELSRG